MNINNVYEAEIWRVCDIKLSYGFESKVKTEFVRKTLFYKDNNGYYVDIITKKIYVFGQKYDFIDDLFIKPETMIPISELIDARRDNMTKRKILKKYKEKSKGE